MAYRAAVAPRQDPNLTTTMDKLAMLLALPAPTAAMTAAVPIAAITGPAGTSTGPNRAGRHAVDRIGTTAA